MKYTQDKRRFREREITVLCGVKTSEKLFMSFLYGALLSRKSPANFVDARARANLQNRKTIRDFYAAVSGNDTLRGSI